MALIYEPFIYQQILRVNCMGACICIWQLFRCNAFSLFLSMTAWCMCRAAAMTAWCMCRAAAMTAWCMCRAAAMTAWCMCRAAAMTAWCM